MSTAPSWYSANSNSTTMPESTRDGTKIVQKHHPTNPPLNVTHNKQDHENPCSSNSNTEDSKQIVAREGE
jgi:hypothetical protein